uniref:Uncharacterized protein n=1 Tax=Arundo donax TaxID=35708 RepID=A0A0A9A2Y9_ARUDO
MRRCNGTQFFARLKKSAATLRSQRAPSRSRSSSPLFSLTNAIISPNRAPSQCIVFNNHANIINHSLDSCRNVDINNGWFGLGSLFSSSFLPNLHNQLSRDKTLAALNSE